MEARKYLLSSLGQSSTRTRFRRCSYPFRQVHLTKLNWKFGSLSLNRCRSSPLVRIARSWQRWTTASHFRIILTKYSNHPAPLETTFTWITKTRLSLHLEELLQAQIVRTPSVKADPRYTTIRSLIVALKQPVRNGQSPNQPEETLSRKMTRIYSKRTRQPRSKRRAQTTLQLRRPPTSANPIQSRDPTQLSHFSTRPSPPTTQSHPSVSPSFSYLVGSHSRNLPKIRSHAPTILTKIYPGTALKPSVWKRRTQSPQWCWTSLFTRSTICRLSSPTPSRAVKRIKWTTRASEIQTLARSRFSLQRTSPTGTLLRWGLN